MRMRPRSVLIGVLTAMVLVGSYQAFGLFSASANSGRIEVWHGLEQRVGHLGDAQDDFNLQGQIPEIEDLFSLQYSLNGGIPVQMNTQAFRRLAADGHFNADIPISDLRPGENEVMLRARFNNDDVARQVVTVTRETGEYSLPVEVDWSEVADAQDVGQYLDGEWLIGEHGLRTAHVGYDRLYLIGERSWQDYEVTAEITVHDIDYATGPASGGPGVGFIMRFIGHYVGGEDRFPIAQPKWGYQPLGAMTWVTWHRRQSERPPVHEFIGGHVRYVVEHDELEIEIDKPYMFKARVETLPDEPDGRGVSRYALKVWPVGEQEPDFWDWEEVLVGENALRHGGLALVAHYVDASFGDISIVRLEPGVS